jgi:hypothetical protein
MSICVYLRFIFLFRLTERQLELDFIERIVALLRQSS